MSAWKIMALVAAGAVVVASLMALPAIRADGELVSYVAVLSGREEVPLRVTHGRGVAHFQVSPDGTSIGYRMEIANIENVFMAHIHMAPVGVNGGIVVWLYPSVAPIPGPTGGGRVEGVLATGTITAANLVGALAGQPLSSLIGIMENGRAYVNVHTDDGMAPLNTGPGDFPGGEIRGQIVRAED